MERYLGALFNVLSYKTALKNQGGIQMKKIFILSLCVILSLISIFAYAAEDIENIEIESYPTFIIIKGRENIKAYEDAGIIRSSSKAVNRLSGIGIMGINIPTRTWDLNNSSKPIDYSFSSYIYSNYKYLPCPDFLGSTGWGIYHLFEPNQRQKMRLAFYSNDGFEFNSSVLDMDDVTLYGAAVRNKAHYIKYTSTQGTRISGTGLVY